MYLMIYKFDFVCIALFWMFFCLRRFTSFYFVCFSILSQHKLVWFGLVSLFNGISTLFRLFNAKAILLEEQ